MNRTSKQSSQENTINQTEQNQPTENNSSSQQDLQLITENEAIQKVKDEFPPIRTGNDYRIDSTRTDNMLSNLLLKMQKVIL